MESTIIIIKAMSFHFDFYLDFHLYAFHKAHMIIILLSYYPDKYGPLPTGTAFAST